MRIAAAAALVLGLALSACSRPANEQAHGDTDGFNPVDATFDPITDATAGTSTTSTTRPTSTSSTVTSTTQVVASASPTPGGALTGLTIAPEQNADSYNRDLFNHWTDDDHDGCDTRCEVLEAERRTDLPGLTSGWLSLYDGYTTDDPSELDIDHVVALSEAWRSGASSWDPARRQAFANDLTEPDALMAVTAATNRSKGDRDAANWQPPNRGAWCQWATATVTVKRKWSLSVDQAEATALQNILSGCG